MNKVAHKVPFIIIKIIIKITIRIMIIKNSQLFIYKLEQLNKLY